MSIIPARRTLAALKGFIVCVWSALIFIFFVSITNLNILDKYNHLFKNVKAFLLKLLYLIDFLLNSIKMRA